MPFDTALLHRLVREMAVVVESRTSEVERLQSIIKKLQRAQFGRRSERLDADQLALALEDLDGDLARIRESRPIVIAETDDGRPKRKPLADHLPREDIMLAIAGDICGCCGGALHAIGESVSETLDWVPAQLRVVRIVRPKYACRSCNKVVQAAAPERLIAGGLATPALLAQVWSANIAITLRFIGSRRSSPVTASISDARRWPDGLAAHAGGWKHCTSDCAKTCLLPAICSPTTPRSRCSRLKE
jgi:transposase